MVDTVIKRVKSIMSGDATGHDFFHAQRVANTCEQLLRRVEADPFITIMAAWLHDLEDVKISHDPQRAEKLLVELDMAAETRSKILSITRNCSYSATKSGKQMTTIEGMIVQDADRLDALGAIGIARCFAYGGRNQRPLYRGQTDDDSSLAHFYDKLLKLKDLMNLQASRRIARRRSRYLTGYLRRFLREWDEFGD